MDIIRKVISVERYVFFNCYLLLKTSMLNYLFSTYTASKNVLFACGLYVTQTIFLLRHSSALYSFNKKFKKMKIHLEI